MDPPAVHLQHSTCAKKGRATALSLRRRQVCPRRVLARKREQREPPLTAAAPVVRTATGDSTIPPTISKFFKKIIHSLTLITSATGMLASVLAAISIAGIGAGSCRGAAATFSACSFRITLIFSRSSFSCAGPEEHEARLGGAKRRSEAGTASGRQGSASCLLVHEQFDVLREPRVRVSYQRLDLGDRIA